MQKNRYRACCARYTYTCVVGVDMTYQSNVSYGRKVKIETLFIVSQIARFMGPTWGPPGSCWSHMGPMLAPWTLLSGWEWYCEYNSKSNLDRILNGCKIKKLESPTCPFYWHGLTFIPAWIGNYIHYRVWDERVYLFPNFNGFTVEVWEWISNFIPYLSEHAITYSCWD